MSTSAPLIHKEKVESLNVSLTLTQVNMLNIKEYEQHLMHLRFSHVSEMTFKLLVVIMYVEIKYRR